MNIKSIKEDLKNSLYVYIYNFLFQFPNEKKYFFFSFDKIISSAKN